MIKFGELDCSGNVFVWIISDEVDEKNLWLMYYKEVM